MLHHISLGTTDIEVAARFYDAALSALGYGRVWSDLRPGESGQAVGYGHPGSGDKLAIKQVGEPVPRIPGFHLAFTAPNRAAVPWLEPTGPGHRVDLAAPSGKVANADPRTLDGAGLGVLGPLLMADAKGRNA